MAHQTVSGVFAFGIFLTLLGIAFIVGLHRQLIADAAKRLGIEHRVLLVAVHG